MVEKAAELRARHTRLAIAGRHGPRMCRELGGELTTSSGLTPSTAAVHPDGEQRPSRRRETLRANGLDSSRRNAGRRRETSATAVSACGPPTGGLSVAAGTGWKPYSAIPSLLDRLDKTEHRRRRPQDPRGCPLVAARCKFCPAVGGVAAAQPARRPTKRIVTTGTTRAQPSTGPEWTAPPAQGTVAGARPRSESAASKRARGRDDEPFGGWGARAATLPQRLSRRGGFAAVCDVYRSGAYPPSARRVRRSTTAVIWRVRRGHPAAAAT
jgi:hypothetical protein